MNAKALAALLLSAVAVSAFAGEATLTRIDAPAGAPRTVAEAVLQLRANRATRAAAAATAGVTSAKAAHRPGRIRPNVIEYETADTAFLIPAAASAAGSNGTFFKSDLTLGNFNNTTQNIGVGWLVTGKDNTNAPLTFFTIPANSIVTLNDFVGTTLKTSGLGALLFIAYDATGQNTDDQAFIDGFSRIWTPQPGSAGTVSQSFPSVSLLDSSDNFTAFALGLRQDASFRTNVGVVNLDTAPHTWTVASLNNTGKSFTITVPPFSLAQTGVPADFGGTGGNLSITFDVPDTNIFWSAYASSVDNVTGDGWVARATQ
jgi:hypothetical protein